MEATGGYMRLDGVFRVDVRLDNGSKDYLYFPNREWAEINFPELEAMRNAD